MIELERPDLSGVDEDVLAYIEALEAALAATGGDDRADAPAPDEPPTSVNLVTISAAGVAKRTPRHLYGRQRRGGMGVFDLEAPDEDYPALLALADADDALLLITDQGRAFRHPISAIPETAVRARGQSLPDRLRFRPQERIVAALPADQGSGQYVALLSRRGWVRLVPRARLSAALIPGMSFFDTGRHGAVAAACWASDGDHLFVATGQGKAIRFLATQVHKQGSLGIRLDPDEEAVAVTAVTESSGVLLVGDDGRGTIRLMAGFRANKAPGAAGKVAIKADRLVGAVAVAEAADAFLISQTGKVIRFAAAEVPPKTGVVQGVNLMSLRHDQVTAVAVTAAASS